MSELANRPRRTGELMLNVLCAPPARPGGDICPLCVLTATASSGVPATSVSFGTAAT